jgi:biotin synthase
LIEPERVLAEAKVAKARGATRFCMGAAWKSPNARDFARVLDMIRGVKALGLECCATLGALSAEQARAMKEAGLGYYNHNLDTSREHYDKIVSTRSYQDRLDTLARVRDAGIKVCCGGILGMGEAKLDRAKMLMELANMPRHPESVPINLLVKVKGTPLENADDIDPFDFVRVIAVARIMMPTSYVRLSAGRRGMDDALQALCFFAGANSIFFGEKLLTTANAAIDHDLKLLARLGLKPQVSVQEPAKDIESERSIPERAGNPVPA